jgi:hypothetical protein
VGGEPVGDDAHVAGPERGSLRVGDDVHHLRQVDEDQPPAVHQQVERGQIAMRQALAGEDHQGVDELVPRHAQLRRLGSQLRQPGSGLPVRLVEVLQQQLGAIQLHRVGHRGAEAPESAQRGKLAVGHRCGAVAPGADPIAAAGDDRSVDDDNEFPAGSIERSDNSGIRIRSVNGWTLIVRTDQATRLVSLSTEDPEGNLVGSRILGTDDCHLLVNALHAALEQIRTSGGPVMIDISQVIGRD